MTAIVVVARPSRAVEGSCRPTPRGRARRALGVTYSARLIVLSALVAAANAVAFVARSGSSGGRAALAGCWSGRAAILLPASAIAGAILLAATSLVSKSILPGVIIPVGIITALIGVPFFLALIFSRRRQLWS